VQALQQVMEVELTMLQSIPARSTASLIASLLLFRAVYYLVPFVLALATSFYIITRKE
jgi:uncharacterized membrane protein YbhN (UPF0104 family)